MAEQRSLIIGCGYLGTRLAQHHQAQGLMVTGVVRSTQGLQRLVQAGVPGLICDLQTADPAALPLAGADVFMLAPPPNSGREDTLSRRLVAAFARVGSPRRVVYLSTTSVYGDCQGEWIDESRPTDPGADRAWRRLDAEQTFEEWHAAGGGELMILRVAGIYGPGRLPLERLRQGLPLVRVQQAPYSNRIHVDDLVNVCAAAMKDGSDGAIYNVSDGHPSTMTEYFQRIAEMAGLAPPPLIDMNEAPEQLSAGMLSYMRESRRLSNRRLREELGVELRYPTLEEGLAASMAS